jgi:hypothetical protein
VTSPDRQALCLEMRSVLLVLVLVASAACGAYRFPGPGNGTGTVIGHVVAYPCGPVEPADQMCIPVPATECVPKPPVQSSCGGYPVPGLGLFFTNGDTTLDTKADSDGYYSIELPSGTWSVSTKSIARIMSGPLTLKVTAGDKIVANYVIDTGIRAASGSASGAPGDG